MVANGYDNILDNKYYIPCEGETTYIKEVDKYLGFHKLPGGYDDDDYFSHLISNLNIFGHKIKKDKRLIDVFDFIEYIIQNYDTDNRIEWTDIQSFIILIYDSSFSLEKAWPVYKFLFSTTNISISIFHYAGYLLGLHLFGVKAKALFKASTLPGGYQLLSMLNKNCL